MLLFILKLEFGSLFHLLVFGRLIVRTHFTKQLTLFFDNLFYRCQIHGQTKDCVSAWKHPQCLVNEHVLSNIYTRWMFCFVEYSDRTENIVSTNRSMAMQRSQKPANTPLYQHHHHRHHFLCIAPA